MVRVNISNTKAHLSEYLDQLDEGTVDVVVLCRRDEPVAELRALPRPASQPRPIGLAAGKLQVPPSFFEPLPDDLAAALLGET